MLLSIIVPMYNVSQYIDKCINSLVNQNINDYEIIIIDDNSSDDSLLMAKKWEKNYSFINIINKQYNSGLSDTRNLGIKAAKGEYILFIDSDDFVDNNCLFALENELIKYQPDVLYFGYLVEHNNRSEATFNYKSKKNQIYSRHDFMLSELKLRNLPIPACVACYKKSLIIDNNIFFETEILHEDVRWSPIIIYHADKVYTSELCFYHYVLRCDSISQKKDRTKNGRDLLSTCAYLDDFCNDFSDCNLKRYFMNYVAMTYMKSVAVNNMVNDEKCIVDRSYPINRVNNVKDYIKAFIFFISPSMYSKIYMFIKLKLKKDLL